MDKYIAIITPLPIEKDAVLKIFNIKKIPKQLNGRYYYISSIPSANSSKLTIICAQCKRRGNASANTLTTNIISQFKPLYIILVGICGGVYGRDNVKYGDIIISDKISYYELQKISEETIEDRSNVMQPPSSFLLEKVRILQTKQSKWYRKITALRPDNKENPPNVIIGEILTGEKLLNTPKSKLLKDLLIKHDKAIGVEMEAGGVANAIYEDIHERNINFLVIRSVSDYCNRKGQSIREQWRKYASEAAAAFTYELVREIPVSTIKDNNNNIVKSSEYLKNLKSYIKTSFYQYKPNFNIIFSCQQHENKSYNFNQLKINILNLNRIIIRGRAGAGKSATIMKLTDFLLSKNHVPVLLNLKEWDKAHSQELDKLKQRYSIEEQFNAILKVSIVNNLKEETVQNFIDNHKRVYIIVDGLNQMFGADAIENFVSVLTQYAKKSKFIYLIITDRLKSRIFIDQSWIELITNDLNASTVKKYINHYFGKGNYNRLKESGKKLLQIPFFLNYALNNKTKEFDSAYKAINSFFEKHIGLKSWQIDKLARCAFLIYKKFKATSFPSSYIKEKIGMKTYNQLLHSGVLIIENAACFSHHLEHDYLISKYLAKNKKWNISQLDIASFQSNSDEAIQMTLEQLSNYAEGDKFIKIIYDWNWYIAICCIVRALKYQKRYFSRDLIIALIVLIKEKYFDKIYWTQKRAGKMLSDTSLKSFKKYIDAPSLNTLIDAVRTTHSNVSWFQEWKKIYTSENDTGIENTIIRKIVSKDSILGWTASNVLKRIKLSKENINLLINLINLHNGNSDIDKTIRWRIIHTLGSFPAYDNMKLLLNVLDNDKYLWSKYGAGRSLAEMTARSDIKLNSKILLEIKSRLTILPSKILDEIGQSFFYESISKTKGKRMLLLLNEIYKSQSDDTDIKKWEQTIGKFKSHLKGGLCYEKNKKQ